jgi:sporulation protein YlmC with PRC-barrel domain
MARGEESRGLRDEANVGPDPRQARELRRMSELGNWRVVDGEPDIRDWPVYASTGREVGIVDDLLVDVEAGEVVMLDVDLKRDDRHTLAPLRAAWIDRATRRVVLDAREVERAVDAVGMADVLPALPRHGALSDDDVRRFNDDYERAYGARGVDAARDYRLRRGDEEIRFGLQPRADLPARADERAAERAEARAEERAVARAEERADARVAERIAEHDEGPRRLLSPDERPHGDPLREVIPRADAMGPTAHTPVPPVAAAPPDPATRAAAGEATLDESRRINETLADLPEETLVEREGRDIEPRELDGRVRIDEGGTVDEATPVAGVRYDTPNYPHHDYEDDPEYDAARAADAERRVADRRVRYRTYPADVGRPTEDRR